jgi:monoamine oxidase
MLLVRSLRALAVLLLSVPAFAQLRVAEAPAVEIPAVPAVSVSLPGLTGPVAPSAQLGAIPALQSTPAETLSPSKAAVSVAVAVPAGPAPRIAVIGGGIAGLAAIHELAKFGLEARLYESEARLGGRVKADSAEGLVLDAGAEFVNRTHKTMLALMSELGVKAIRRKSIRKKKTFLFEGRAVSESAFMRTLFTEAGPQLRAIARDDAELRRAIAESRPEVLRRYDTKTIGAYLDELEAPASLRNLVKAVVESESGRDYAGLSSVVLFECFSVDPKAKRIAILPDEDESFKIRGGAARIVDGLAARHAASMSLEHRLTAIESDDGKVFKLTFETPRGRETVVADHVVLAVPPPALRGVDVRVPGWTPELKKKVDAVEFGSHLKLSLIFAGRPWRKKNHSGGGLVDSGLAFWESSEGQKGPRGSITFFGRAAALENRTSRELAWSLLSQLELAFPGLTKRFRGYRVEVWPRSFPFADGPGDPYGYVLTFLERRVFSKFDAKPLGNLRWAGDIFSGRSPAYMNGAAETGIAAARDIAAAVRK